MTTARKFGLMMLAIVGMLVVLGYATRTEPASYTPSVNTPIVPAGPAAPAPVYNQRQCDQLRAQMDVNQRLAQDGYAADYSQQYQSLMQAAGCP